jgi:hypothetical protein
MSNTCTNCEKHVEALSNFCKHCGHDIASFGRKLEKKCPGCKAFIDPVAKFCRHCGEGFHILAKMGPFGLVVTIAILTAIILLGAFGVYGLTTKVPYTVTVPYTTIETYDEVLPVVSEQCESESSVQKKVTFRAQKNYLASQGFGALDVDFAKRVNNCKVTGKWITDNWEGNQKRYCHKMKGTFEGSANRFGQSVTFDPEAFDWQGISHSKLYNPPAETINGFSAHAYLCDTRGYETKRNFVRAKLSGFGTKVLNIDWDYLDVNTRPAVEFELNLVCGIGESSCVQVSSKKVVEKQREVTKYKEETKYRLLILDWFAR